MNRVIAGVAAIGLTMCAVGAFVNPVVMYVGAGLFGVAVIVAVIGYATKKETT